MRLFLHLVVFILSTSQLLQAQQTVDHWDEQNQYINGYARVFAQDKFSFINSREKLISPFQFEDARNFYHHLAAVKMNSKWGFIKENGNFLLPCNYDIVFDFKNEFTIISRDSKWWMINQKGQFIKSLDITVCLGFEKGLAIVEKNGRCGLLNWQGNISWNTSVSQNSQHAIPYFSPNSPLTNNSCPDNLDFEFGNFTNWQCYIGNVDSIGNTNIITVNPSAPIVGRHTIYARAIPSAIDPFGLFPTNPPDGSQFAVKLGNTGVGAQAERIRYTIRVPANDSNFSFRYHYSVVLQDPGHTPWTQPRFTAKLLDSATNTYIDCASFEYISTSSLPGFTRSTVDTSVIFKPWSPVFISLRGYAGKTLYLDFTTADCVRRAHWGYAYVDVEDMCGQAIQVNYQCDTPHATTLTGPPGFQIYNWWDQSFTNLLGNGQQITLNPGPAPNTLLWLEVIPFANFGCLDTIPVRVNGTSIAQLSSSDTLGICAPHSFTFYNQLNSLDTAHWDFGDGNNAIGDTVTHVFNLPGNYIVTMTVGNPMSCLAIAVDTIHVVQPTGAFSYVAGNFCNTQLIQFTATTQYIDSLFWTFGDGTFLNTTQNTVSHTYLQPGIFLPQLKIKSNAGCEIILPGTDTIKIEKLIPGFTKTIQHTCTSTEVSFTDTSHSYFGINTRTWYFGDGTIASGNQVSHTYLNTGTYQVKLIITGITGCVDSISLLIFIQVYELPIANIIGDSLRCANTSIIFSNSILSTDSVNVKNWTCSNGAIGTGNNFTVQFPNPGQYTIRLIVTTVYGCSDTSFKIVQINPMPITTAGLDKILCLGSSIQLNATGADLYTWSPANYLSCANCPNPIANPIDTIEYIVKGTSLFGCIVYDTMQIKVRMPFQISASPDDTICIGKSINLNSIGANNYAWSPSTGLNRSDIANPIASPNSTTTYQVIGSDGYNCFTDTAYIKITVGPLPIVTLGPDLNLATGEIVQLQPSIQNGPIIKWLWEPATYLSCNNCSSPQLTVHDDKSYFVTVTNTFNCVAKDAINIFTFCKSAQVFVPNAFTPDGDRVNDILMVRGKGIFVNYFRIFNRWGELVFEKNNFPPNEMQFGWDGKIRGVLAPPDVFVYTVEVICDNNMKYTLKGNTTLLK
ncbi:MAG: PKD domain-containing protein [Chitinophagaceae bacterium]